MGNEKNSFGSYIIKSKKHFEDYAVIGVIHTNAPDDVMKDVAKSFNPDSRMLFFDAMMCLLKVRGYDAYKGFVKEIEID